MRGIFVAIHDRRGCWRDLLVFEILLKILQGAVLTPVLAWMGMLLIKTTGRTAISNTDILSFLLSPLGLAGLLTATAIAMTLVYLEQAGIMIIAWGAISGSRGAAWSALSSSIRYIPKLFWLAVRQLAVLLVWLVPLAGAGVIAQHLLLSSEVDVNYYLTHKPSEFVWASAIIGTLLLLAALILIGFVIRWVFAMQGVLFDDKRPRAALSESARLVRGSFARVVRMALACLAFAALLPLLVTWLLGLLDGVLFAVAGDNLDLVIPIGAGLLVLHWLAAAVTAAVGFSIYVLVITRLYLDVTGRHEPEPVESEPPQPAAEAKAGWPRRGLRLFAAAAIVLLLLSVGGTYMIAEQLDFRHHVAITAHRGYSAVAPENTLLAIEKAIEGGADFAEIDVQLTADEVVVVIHDADFMKIANDPRKVSEVSYDEIRQIDAGSWVSPKFKDERIPTLAEVIAIARGKIKLNIELKFNGDREVLTRKVVDMIQEHELHSECVVTSLDEAGLGEVKRLDPRLKTGFITGKTIGRITDLEVDFWSVNSSMADAELLADAREARKDVHVWTVNNPREMARMIDRGVDNIITDKVDEAVAVRRKLSQLADAERLVLAFRNWMRD